MVGSEPSGHASWAKNDEASYHPPFIFTRILLHTFIVQGVRGFILAGGSLGSCLPYRVSALSIASP